MSKVQRSTQTCDCAALQSLEIGVLVVLLTGCVHYLIMASSHFDFLIPYAEFVLVMGVAILPPALIILAIAIETQLLRFVQIKSLFEF